MKKEFGKYSSSELFKAMRNKKSDAEGAFAELYSRYSQRVFAYCLRITGNPDDSRDIFQETFLKFYSFAQGKRKVDNVGAYILTIARNLCFNYKTRNKANFRFEDYLVPTNDEQYEDRELREVLANAIELLELDYREAFVLRQYQGLSYQEMEEITGENTSTLKNRVWRAKEKLRNILAPYMSEINNYNAKTI
ncbi:MAG: polymerase, sigma-24 subunit, subfamily [Ignavibacteria bacterium]|nr:polymerase, sigma-24 subunit, subfamily [Ignavibacteria bacterium]